MQDPKSPAEAQQTTHWRVNTVLTCDASDQKINGNLNIIYCDNICLIKYIFLILYSTFLSVFYFRESMTR